MTEAPHADPPPEDGPASLPPISGSGAVPPGHPGTARASTWKQLLRFGPDVARLLVDVSRDPRVRGKDKILAGAVAAYLVSPIDLIPDFIPAVGQMDDITLAVWAVRRLMRGAGYDVLKDLWRGTDDGFALLLLVAGIEE